MFSCSVCGNTDLALNYTTAQEEMRWSKLTIYYVLKVVKTKREKKENTKYAVHLINFASLHGPIFDS